MDSQGQPGFGSYPNPAYPPQGGYPPPGGYPQYPPNQGYPQPGYPGPPPPTGFVNPGYPNQGGGYIPPGGGYPPPAPGYQQPGVPPYGGGPSNLSNMEDGSVKGFDFSDKSIRLAFIRKVYSILMLQLLVTFGFIALCLLHKPTQKFIMAHHEIWWIALVIMFVTLISMACCSSVRRRAPMNFIFLFLFTLAESFLLGVSSSNYQSVEVLMAVGVTAAVCLALTLFAFQTKWDFTNCGAFLLVATVILLILGIFAIFFPGKTLSLVYASLGALLFSMYLVYDTQLMMGGNHKYSISPEEYIFAALNLYLDVINIFMYILTIIGAARD